MNRKALLLVATLPMTACGYTFGSGLHQQGIQTVHLKVVGNETWRQRLEAELGAELARELDPVRGPRQPRERVDQAAGDRGGGTNEEERKDERRGRAEGWHRAGHGRTSSGAGAASGGRGRNGGRRTERENDTAGRGVNARVRPPSARPDRR